MIRPKKQTQKFLNYIYFFSKKKKNTDRYRNWYVQPIYEEIGANKDDSYD